MGHFSSLHNKLILKSVLLWHITKQVTQYLSFPMNNLNYSTFQCILGKFKIFPFKITLNKHMNLQLNNIASTFETNHSYLYTELKLSALFRIVTAEIYCILFHLLYIFHCNKI